MTKMLRFSIQFFHNNDDGFALPVKYSSCRTLSEGRSILLKKYSDGIHLSARVSCSSELKKGKENKIKNRRGPQRVLQGIAKTIQSGLDRPNRFNHAKWVSMDYFE